MCLLSAYVSEYVEWLRFTNTNILLTVDPNFEIHTNLHLQPLLVTHIISSSHVTIFCIENSYTHFQQSYLFKFIVGKQVFEK